MKQIIVITDGCSNVGISPVIAAASAFAEGIVVNVVGVVDRGEIGELGASEIREVAEAGGGLSRIVGTRELSRTVQMMTRKTVTHTIQQAVQQELRSILGAEGLGELHPDKRAQVVRAIDEMSETAPLRVALLIDASASMKPKLAAVEEATRDLLLSLQARAGESELAVYHFPGKGEAELAMDVGWTHDLAKVRNLFYKLNMKGTTPTGPAIMQLIPYLLEKRERVANEPEDHRASAAAPLDHGKDGMLDDYVV